MQYDKHTGRGMYRCNKGTDVCTGTTYYVIRQSKKCDELQDDKLTSGKDAVPHSHCCIVNKTTSAFVLTHTRSTGRGFEHFPPFFFTNLVTSL